MSAIPDFSTVDLASSSNKRETLNDWTSEAANVRARIKGNGAARTDSLSSFTCRIVRFATLASAKQTRTPDSSTRPIASL